MQYDSEIVPIEVKSGTNINAKSLKLFRETYSPKISIRFSLRNTRLDNGLQNISLFSVFLCEQLIESSSGKCVKQVAFSSGKCVKQVAFSSGKCVKQVAFSSEKCVK
jgi:hypothetical protein